MFELFTVIIFAWLFFKSIGLAVKLTWGAARIAATVLVVLALPLLVLFLLFMSGIVLLVPVIMVGIAVGILKAVAEA